MSDYVIPTNLFLLLLLMAIVLGLVTYGVLHALYLIKEQRKVNSERPRRRRTGQKIFVHRSVFPFKLNKTSCPSRLPHPIETTWNETEVHPYVDQTTYYPENDNEMKNAKNYSFLLTPTAFLQNAAKKQSNIELEYTDICSDTCRNQDIETDVESGYFHDSDMSQPLL